LVRDLAGHSKVAVEAEATYGMATALHSIRKCAIVRSLKKDKFVNAEFNQDQGFSRDAALMALAHARDQIAGPNQPRRDELVDGELRGSKMLAEVKVSPPSTRTPAVTPSERSVGDRISIWGLLIGLGALVPVGAIFLAWHFLTRPGDEFRLSTSSISKELVATAPSLGAAATDNDNAIRNKSAQAKPPSFASLGPELAQSIASVTHQLTDSEREIDKLKAQQTQILVENLERDKHFEEKQELVRRNAALIKDLQSAESQMAQDNANLAERLKASQEQVALLAAQLDASQIQMAKIAAQTKASQDQLARAAGQKQRSRPLVAVSQPASGQTNKPSLKPQPQPTIHQTQKPGPTPIR
jgi:hypothetical protein